MIIGNISGSLAYKGKKWYLVINVRDSDGRKRQMWEPTDVIYPGNKRQANEVLRIRLEQLNQSISSKNMDFETTVDGLIDNWLNEAKLRVRANTYERYQLTAKKIKKYYATKKIRVVDYTRADAIDFLGYLSTSGKINQATGAKEPLAANTIRDIRMCLKMAFDTAINSGIITINPVVGTRITAKATAKVKYMDKATAQQFISFVHEEKDILRDVIVVAINFGLRKSEILGLTYESINFSERTIHIYQTVTATTTTHVEYNTKSKNSNRYIPITDKEVDFFKSVMQRKKEWQDYFGKDYKDSDFLLTKPDGTTFHPDFMYKHTKKLLEEFGEPDLTFHSFRHTYCSILYDNGVDLLTAQRLMGHADSETTLNIYTHIDRKKAVACPTGLDIGGKNGR